MFPTRRRKEGNKTGNADDFVTVTKIKMMMMAIVIVIICLRLLIVTTRSG